MEWRTIYSRLLCSVILVFNGSRDLKIKKSMPSLVDLDIVPDKMFWTHIIILTKVLSHEFCYDSLVVVS